MISDMEAEEIARLYALTDVSGIGHKRAAKLIETVDGIRAVYNADSSDFNDLYYVDSETIAEIQSLESNVVEYTKKIRSAQEDGINVLTIYDDKYPNELRMHHAPLIIFARGDISLLKSNSVSFAGSRSSSDEAIEWARKAAAQLADKGYTIVSGGAFGIDEAAHQGALDMNQATIVVQPAGLNELYPPANKELFSKIVKDGLLISHQFPGEEATRSDFLYRNQTNSGLSQALVAVAAEESSGTMSQVGNAKSQNKHIFCPYADLNLEPTAGIDKIRDDKCVMMVRSGAEIANALHTESDQSSLADW